MVSVYGHVDMSWVDARTMAEGQESVGREGIPWRHEVGRRGGEGRGMLGWHAMSLDGCGHRLGHGGFGSMDVM